MILKIGYQKLFKYPMNERECIIGRAKYFVSSQKKKRKSIHLKNNSDFFFYKNI